MLPGQQRQQPFRYLNEDIYTALILEEAEKLYNKLTTKLTNEVIASATASKETSLSLLSPSGNNNNQKLIYENDRYDETEEPRYINNRSAIYNNDYE